MSAGGTTEERVDTLYERLDREATDAGYHLNPDREFTRALVEGLVANQDRYGYRSCPCRLAAEDESADLDIICPCDYRDPDLAEWGACYCALYVSQEVVDGKRELTSIPERRPPEEERHAGAGAGAGMLKAAGPVGAGPGSGRAAVHVWRCRVCGYLCARPEPPEKCPICKAKKERFELFWE